MANVAGQEPIFDPLMFWEGGGGGGAGGGGGGGGGVPPPGPGPTPGNFLGGRAQSLMAPNPGSFANYGYQRNRLRPFGAPPQMPNRSGVSPMTAGAGGGTGPSPAFGGRPAAPPYALGGGFFGDAVQSYLNQQSQRANPGANPGHLPFDPNDPFAGSYPNQLGTSEDIMGYLLRQYARGGGFNPMGDPRITSMLREKSIQDANAQQHAARVGLIGRSDVDPSTFGFQSLMGDLNSQSNVAQGMNAAQLQQALAMQQFMQHLFSGSALGTQQSEAEKRAQDAQRIWQGGQHQFDWGGLAQGAGKLAGAFF